MKPLNEEEADDEEEDGAEKTKSAATISRFAKLLL